MFIHPYVATALLAAFTVTSVSPAAAIDGEILITHQKALSGNVTPGDPAGYPVIISRAGSYKLASNLEVSASKNGIVVNATEVSIDLNGFRLNGRDVAGHGIIGTQRSLTVRNGTILFFNGDGIQMRGALLIVENMRIEENGGRGVNETGTGFARIIGSTIFANGLQGIRCGLGCHIEGNNISRNGTAGAISGVLIAGGVVLGNTIFESTAFGISATPKVGFGNNTIMDNPSGSTDGGPVPLHPNACSPAC